MEREYKRYRAEIAEAYLDPIRRAGQKLRVKSAELAEERERVIGIMGPDYSRPIAAQSANGDKVPEAVARLVALEDAYRADFDAVTEMRDEARARLDAMGGRAADLLRLRYVSALSWSAVADCMSLAESTVRNMRVDALCRFFDYLPHTARPPAQAAFPERIF